MLNAVFALHYFSRRFSGNIAEYGLGPIGLSEALGDLFPPKQIDKAVAQSDALTEEGIRLGQGPWNWDSDMDHLRQAHPGFNVRPSAMLWTGVASTGTGESA
ncbi:hypothetical protein [Pseudarthrobacter albicanus]|uniref:hypothetical protein n=1 Tax=Pseudarthrobacter albicanus TaxID=2823873 RepID=UPI001BA923F9|nr:hypothetical protein [Pseudarthrobacter albicanus]